MARITKIELIQVNEKLAAENAALRVEVSQLRESLRMAQSTRSYTPETTDEIRELQKRGMPRFVKYGVEVMPNETQIRYWKWKLDRAAQNAA